MLAGGALDALAGVAEGLDVDAARMRTNLGITRGLVFAEAVQMALAPDLGKDAAHALVARACRRAAAENAHLRDILAREPDVTRLLDRARIDALFDPAGCLGESEAYVARALARHPPRP